MVEINPTESNNSSDNNGMGTGFLIGAITSIVFAVIFFAYALPYIRGIGSGGVQAQASKSIDARTK